MKKQDLTYLLWSKIRNSSAIKGILGHECVNEIIGEDKLFSPVLTNPEIFCEVVVQTGGHGIAWGVNHTISDETLYQSGEAVPLSMNDFKSFIKNRIVSTKEATEMLDCSRQNIDDLVKRDKLHPVKVDAKNKLFLKTEIEQRNWQ